MSNTPPALKKVRIQDVTPGMKTARINRDLDFVYMEIEKVTPVKRLVGRQARTVSYQVRLVGWVPGTHQDSCIRPFTVRPTQRIDIVDEEI